MATFSNILAWRTPWTKELGRPQSRGCKESNMTEQRTHTHTHTHTNGLGRDEGVGGGWRGEGGTGLALWVPRAAWFFPVIYLTHPVP